MSRDMAKSRTQFLTSVPYCKSSMHQVHAGRVNSNAPEEEEEELPPPSGNEKKQTVEEEVRAAVVINVIKI